MHSTHVGSRGHPSKSSDKSPAPTLRERLLNRHGSILFIKNAAASSVSFLLDLLLIWIMVESLGVFSIVAVAAGFIAANAFHYLLARIWVFRGSERGHLSGYFYFLSNALIGLVVILGAFALLTEVLGVSFIVARVIASLCAGTLVFVLNATLNFRHL
jgi:putative flippase GtrA